MQLEDYFEVISPVTIRVKGTRVGIETILTEYLENKRTAEEIAAEYPAHLHIDLLPRLQGPAAMAPRKKNRCTWALCTDTPNLSMR